jgi:hypothetical protein
MKIAEKSFKLPNEEHNTMEYLLSLRYMNFPHAVSRAAFAASCRSAV